MVYSETTRQFTSNDITDVYHHETLSAYFETDEYSTAYK